ncbi:hypothetical protein JAAARDRAFT_205996 [Jaapia argillacea MUCL 33604]|uniref:Fungal N-terminal domain-containing protein n=1 Tax=Jaapia argillacea MUCL 33604 TaxID=933084 RepID=A0A067PW16_9AGAM|nr:hypothetical protein JAAARDRAFT_205996 [Jaapia argillacea MUCL 33604]
MPFPTTFSSFGDIVAAVQLAVTIAKALDDATGSSSEYQALRSELKSLSQALKLVDRLGQRISFDEDALASISTEVTACHSEMDKFWKRAQGYEQLGHGSQGSAWRKVKWVFKKGAVDGLRAKLSVHRQNIMVFLLVWTTSSSGDILRLTSEGHATIIELGNEEREDRLSLKSGLTDVMSTMRLLLSNIVSIGDVVFSFRDEARQVYGSIQSLLAEVSSVLRGLPPFIGYSRHNAVEFVDVLGVTLTLPMELCLTWSKFDATVKAHFQGRAGQRYVDKGAYEIGHDDEMQPIAPDRWTDTVRKGMLLKMSAVVLDPSREGEVERLCPRCDKKCESVSPSAWAECTYCGCRFQVTTQDNVFPGSVTGESESDTSITSKSDPSESGPSKPGPSEPGSGQPGHPEAGFRSPQEDLDGDRKLFLRIHTIRPTRLLSRPLLSGESIPPHIHAFLDGKVSPPILFDLSISTFNPYGFIGIGKTIPLSSYELSQPATYPPTTRMDITCHSISQLRNLFSNTVLTQVSAVPQTTHITVGAVLDSIYRSLRYPINHQIWDMADSSQKDELTSAYYRRCATSLNTGEFEERKKGVKRVDYLGQKVFFGGLVKDGGSDGFVQMELLVCEKPTNLD